jgi:hypothetical protein
VAGVWYLSSFAGGMAVTGGSSACWFLLELYWYSIGNSGRQLWTIGLVRFSSPASTGQISAWVLECGEWLLELAEEVEVLWMCWGDPLKLMFRPFVPFYAVGGCFGDGSSKIVINYIP